VPADAAVDAAATVVPRRARVRTVDGVVERHAGDTWVAVKAGDYLATNDQIRTATGGSAELELGGEALVTIAERSELTLREISATVSAVRLGGGRVAARATRTSPRIRIATRSGEASAEAIEGTFAAISSGGDDLTIASTTGTVTLEAQGRRVDLAAGKRSTVHPGLGPTAPAPIPGSLFLKVKPVAGGDRTTIVRGETVAGAVVSINGVRTAPDPRGRFDVSVGATEGANVIIVQVEDASGRQQRKVLRRPGDTTAPPAAAPAAG